MPFLSRWRRCALSALIAPLLTALPAQAQQSGPDALPGIIGPDDRVPLDATEWPWGSIGRVNRATGGFCTGMLIGPRHVLTAGHCLTDRRRGQLPPGDVHFVAGYRRGEHVAHSAAQSFVLPPGGGPAEDWAILVLAERMALRPIRIADRDAEPGAANLIRVGYSQNRPHLLSVHRDCRLVGQGGGLLRHDCDGTRGDSGSPILRRIGHDYEIVGITIGAAQSGGQAFGVAVPASAFRGKHLP